VPRHPRRPDPGGQQGHGVRAPMRPSSATSSCRCWSATRWCVPWPCGCRRGSRCSCPHHELRPLANSPARAPWSRPDAVAGKGACPESEPQMKQTAGLLVALVACYGAAVVGGIFTSSSVSTWYQTLHKPSFNPPGWVFGPVWTVLYGMMAVAATTSPGAASPKAPASRPPASSDSTAARAHPPVTPAPCDSARPLSDHPRKEVWYFLTTRIEMAQMVV